MSIKYIHLGLQVFFSCLLHSYFGGVLNIKTNLKCNLINHNSTIDTSIIYHNYKLHFIWLWYIRNNIHCINNILERKSLLENMNNLHITHVKQIHKI
jgi:hypothetical protein